MPAPAKSWAPDRRDVIWIDFDPQMGKEMRQHHPMLVLSPKTFNARTGIVIGLPMTTAASNETNPFAIKFVGPNGLTSYILGHQPKSFDWRARRARPHPWKQVSPAVFESACETLNQIIAIGVG
jgi:mRNA interferase MazF